MSIEISVYPAVSYSLCSVDWFDDLWQLPCYAPIWGLLVVRRHMSLDHYVPQVHLRNFYSKDLGKRMYALRKQDQKEFTPDSSSICRIEDGSTNVYLQDPRAIEEFLKLIEPKYNAASSAISQGSPDQQSIFALSGYMATILTCTPAANRLGSEDLKELLKHLAVQLGKKMHFQIRRRFWEQHRSVSC